MSDNQNDYFTLAEFQAHNDILEILESIPSDDYLANMRRLGALCCTKEEIAAFFETSVTTINNRLKRDKAFRDAYEQGKAQGKLSLRRAQFQLAQEGNATILIWLGKQLLNQSDSSTVKFNMDDCKNNKEKTERILDAVSKGEISIQDGAALINMSKTVIDEETLDAFKRLSQLEDLTVGKQ